MTPFTEFAGPPAGEQPTRGMFVTDLDGTLLREGTVDPADISALEHLGLLGVPRVIATGRSPYSYMNLASGEGIPVDYLILSSGAVIMDCSTGEFVRSVSMSPGLTAIAVRTLKGLGLDFTVHQEVPENHRFLYSMPSEDNPDMDRRIDLYRGYCGPLGDGEYESASTQLVVIAPPECTAGLVPKVSEALGEGYSVVRTTSPLDGESLWIEVFPSNVRKSSGAEWLAGMLGTEDRYCGAVGNDYNDTDLLDWAGASFVIHGSPTHLTERHRTVGSVGEAVQLWVGEWEHLRTGSSAKASASGETV